MQPVSTPRVLRILILWYLRQIRRWALVLVRDSLPSIAPAGPEMTARKLSRTWLSTYHMESIASKLVGSSVSVRVSRGVVRSHNQEALILGVCWVVRTDGCQGMVPEFFNVSYPKVGQMILQESKKLGRPVAYSCSWPAYTIGRYPQQYELMAEHCNTWRNYDDSQLGWESPAHIIEFWANPAPYGGGPNQAFLDVARPGAINDPDELYVGSGSLTHVEEETVFALWAIMTGPMLLGIDFRDVPANSAEILLNAEIIAVSQDPLVRQGRRVVKPQPPPPPLAGSWTQFPTIWNDTCPNVGDVGGSVTVAQCEDHCVRQSSSCTAINWSPSLCILRACPAGRRPNWQLPGWRGYAFNGTLPGRRAAHAQVWYKELANGDRAVAAYNRSAR
eukprot:COSAG01_NODE_4576_length_4908_cov_594.918486_4_plen_389_part_00